MSPHIMLFLLFFSTRSADSNCSNVYIVNDTCENNCCYHTIDGAINALNHTLSDSTTITVNISSHTLFTCSDGQITYSKTSPSETPMYLPYHRMGSLQLTSYGQICGVFDASAQVG
eukprot:162993_1